mgnify:CR=1 FL=1
MKIIDGKALAARLRGELKEKLEKSGKEVGLAVVIVGDNPASKIYVRNKVKACAEVGIRSYSYELPADTAQEDLESLLEQLGGDEKINGILLQLPLPEGLDSAAALKKIPREKDVDGFSAENLGRLALHEEKIAACTPLGIMKILESEGISPAGKHAVVLGRSATVGKPMALLLLNADATVTVCHSKTRGIREICRCADILISAVGKPKFVTADMVKEGAVVIDVGMNRSESGKLCGDVDYENVKDKTSYITPVPGGVGPMTIACLMENTVECFLRKMER